MEEITVDSKVKGLSASGIVTVIAVTWHGNGVLEVTFKDANGILGNQLLYRENEEEIEIYDKKLPWSFDADGEQLRLALEAYRIHLAHLFDPYLAVHTSSVDPYPHQISAVYREMLKRLPLRYVLADDPGAGKTIMTGLLLKELIIRGELKRCMIVAPGKLTIQWQEELKRKFNLSFKILADDHIKASTSGNVFTDLSFCIAPLDKVARSKDLQEKLKVTEWDLIVVDEAHKMSATVFGNKTSYTQRFHLGKLLSAITRNFLLLTATPHNGKNQDFRLFMSLIDEERFGGVSQTKNDSIDVSDIMRRLVKEDCLLSKERRYFPNGGPIR